MRIEEEEIVERGDAVGLDQGVVTGGEGGAVVLIDTGGRGIAEGGVDPVLDLEAVGVGAVIPLSK